MRAAAIPLEREARARRTLLIVAALFLVPLALAFTLYYGSAWRPAGSTNHGELITPVRLLPAAELTNADGSAAAALAFRGKWTLLYLGSGACDEACRHALYTTRQTRLGLANERGRVQRVFLATGGCCDREFLVREHPGLLTLDASRQGAAVLLREFPADDRSDSIFVVDPLGNLLMRFDARANPRGLLEDLERLLTLSHIG